jgi:YHS domain-containing protein
MQAKTPNAKPQADTNTCQVCKKKFPRHNMNWSHDRYGNPWKFCCQNCLDKADAEIADYINDPLDAGEALEPEDY